MSTETPVNERITQLLDRVANVRRASDLHVTFDAKGEAAARRIAERESSQAETNGRG